MSVLTSFFVSPVAPVPKNYFSVTISSKLILEHTLNSKRVTDWNNTHHWKQLSRQNLKYFSYATQLQELGSTLYYISQHNTIQNLKTTWFPNIISKLPYFLKTGIKVIQFNSWSFVVSTAMAVTVSYTEHEFKGHITFTLLSTHSISVMIEELLTIRDWKHWAQIPHVFGTATRKFYDTQIRLTLLGKIYQQKYIHFSNLS